MRRGPGFFEVSIFGSCEVTAMRMKRHGTLEITLLALLVIGTVRVQPVFAKGARGQDTSMASRRPRPSEASAKPALRREMSPQAPAKVDTFSPRRGTRRG